MYILYIRLRGRGRGGVMMVTVVFFILFLLLPTVGVGAFHLLSWVKGGANLPQSIFYNNQVLHIFPIYFLSNAEFSSSLLQHVKQFSTITKSYIPACSNISKLIINNDQTDLNSKYICVVDEELHLHQDVPMPHPFSIEFASNQELFCLQSRITKI